MNVLQEQLKLIREGVIYDLDNYTMLEATITKYKRLSDEEKKELLELGTKHTALRNQFYAVRSIEEKNKIKSQLKEIEAQMNNLKLKQQEI